MSEDNLIQKLSKAMLQITPVEKDGQNKYQHYSFQSEGAIKSVVKKALSDNGIMIIPKYEIIQQYDRKSAKGSITHYVDVMGTFTITDGNEKIFGKMAGSGQDTSEKAMVKAETTAQKYFYKQLFNISDQEEDPDSSDSANGGQFVSMKSTKQQTTNQNELEKVKKEMGDLMAEVSVLCKIPTADLQNKVVEKIKQAYPNSDNFTPVEKFQAMIAVLRAMKKENTGKSSQEMTFEEVTK
ncbi:ERF family protein [Ligilactobacillus sp. LYQ135]